MPIHDQLLLVSILQCYHNFARIHLMPIELLLNVLTIFISNCSHIEIKLEM